MIGRRVGTWSGALSLTVTVAAPVFGQVVPSALLTQGQATCIASRADTYIAENRPVYVVVLPPEDACPAIIDETASLADDSAGPLQDRQPGLAGDLRLPRLAKGDRRDDRPVGSAERAPELSRCLEPEHRHTVLPAGDAEAGMFAGYCAPMVTSDLTRIALGSLGKGAVTTPAVCSAGS